MIKKLVLACFVLSFLFSNETNSSNFKEFFGEKSEFKHPQMDFCQRDKNLLDNNITKSDLKKGEVFIHGGNTVKNKFLVLNKFINSKKIIDNLNDILKEEFQNDKFKEFENSLSYEIFAFNVRKKDSKTEFEFVIKYKITNPLNKKEFKEKEISNIVNLKENSSDEIYKEALNIIMLEIENSIKNTNGK